jgi:hypothetical protein
MPGAIPWLNIDTKLGEETAKTNELDTKKRWAWDIYCN